MEKISEKQTREETTWINLITSTLKTMSEWAGHIHETLEKLIRMTIDHDDRLQNLEKRIAAFEEKKTQ
jgi:hypothetical protein